MTVNAVGGVATFTDLQISGLVGAHTLQFATTTPALNVTSGSFVLAAGTPAQLVVTTQPAGAVSGAAFTAQPVVAIRDASNNVTTSTAAVTVAKLSGTGVLSGTLTVNAVNGMATFTDLTITGTGAHTLQFTTTTPALSVNSASFTVAAAAVTTIGANSVVTQSAVAGAAVTAPPSVLVTDGTNPVSGVTVTFTVTGGGGAISPVSPASVVTNASGIATLTSWTLGTIAGANSVSAAVTGLTGSPVVFDATGIAGAPTQLVVTTEPSGAVSGAAFTTQPVVSIRDANNNVTTSTAAVTVAKLSGTGVLSGTLTVNAVNGVATFTDLALTTTGAHTLQFTTTTPALSVNSASFTVTAAAATTIAANSVVTQSAVAGAAVAAPPSVLVTDGTNPVSGVTVTFTVTGGGGAISPVSPASVVTNASGIATLTSWTLGTTADANSVNATVTGLTGSPVVFNATGIAGAPTQLVVTTEPSGAVSGAAFTTQPVVSIRDANNNVTTSTAAVTVAKLSGTGVLSGTLTVNAVNGVATFTDLALTTTGAHTLQFTTITPALSVNSTSFTVTAAAATTIAANSVVTQSAVAGAAVAAPPSVLVTDGTNPVSGVTVTFTVTGGGGAISPGSPASVVTNASGIATLTSWTLGTIAGANSVSAAVTGLTGSPVVFDATGIAGAPTQLVVTTEPTGAVSGAAFTTQPVVSIRDANNNVTTSTASVTATIATGGGTIGGTVTVSAVSGVATFTDLQITGAIGAHTLQFATTTPALTVNSGSFALAAGAATTVAENSVVTQSAVAGAAVTAPPSVLVTDGTNPVSGVTVTFTVTGGSGVIDPASPASVVTNASGIATLTSWTLGTTAGANTVTATVTGLTGSPVVFNATGTPGAPTQLVIATQPDGAATGVALTVQPIIEIRDANNNVTTSTATVTATVASGPGTLGGTVELAAVNGVATFTDLAITGAGAHTLQFATATPLLTITSGSFTVTAFDVLDVALQAATLDAGVARLAGGVFPLRRSKQVEPVRASSYAPTERAEPSVPQ